MKRTIALVTGGLAFNGNSIYENALGGSESALIYIATELSLLDNDVTVYCKCDKPGIYNNVDYRTIEQYYRDEKSQFDITIVSRFTDFLALPIDSKMNILWCHDIDVNNFRDACGVADRVFCLSDYHKSLYVDNYSIEPSNYIWKTSNGFDQNIDIPLVPFDQKKNNYIYASRPERGLKFLLEKIWPEIVENNPDAILHICGYEHNLGIPDEVKKIHDEVNELLGYSNNVKQVGNLPKQKYYELLANCAYMLYPTDFPEISCINAIEAQNAGCLVITSDNYALSETVKTNTKVKAEYASKEYVNEFISILNTLRDEDAYNNESSYAKNEIKKYSWSNVAKSWMTEINFMFENRFEKHKDQIIKQLVYNSDIVAAWKLTNDKKYRDMLDQAAIDNTTVSDFNSSEKDEDAYLSDRSLALIDIIDKKIREDNNIQLTILDLGSNDGILSLPLLKRFSKNIKELVMYDSSSAVLSFVHVCYSEKYPQLKVIVDTVDHVSTYNFAPDIVIAGELLEHIENTQEFLNSLMTLAQDNTLFYFTVPSGPWESIASNTKHIHHVHHFELEDLQQIFKNTNVTITRNRNTVRGKRGELCGNWIFWFNSSKNESISFEEIDYVAKYKKTRPYKSISCCMIVKNEEDNLSRCLKTVKPHVDEIIIVDTGSTDDTKYIASKFTNKIYDLNWLEDDNMGNFSRARNYSIDKASGDFIFWIDADEQVENFESLFKYITSDYYDGVMLKQRQCMSKAGHEMGINVDVMHDRLFKRGNIRFTGVVHEYPSKDDEHFLSKMFWQDNAWVLHYGLAHQETLRRKSINRNAELIYKNVNTYPNRVFAKHYIIVDYWSQFISGHPTPDFSWLQKGMDFWHNELKDCGDDWTIGLSLGVVQHFYGYCATNGIAYKGKLPQKVGFKNANNEVLEFYVLEPETETEFFLHYLSNFKR